MYDKEGNKIEDKIGLNLVNKDELPSSYYSKKYKLDAVGNVISETDSEGRRTDYTLDKNGHIIEKLEYISEDDKVITKYKNDKSGRVLKESIEADTEDIVGLDILSGLSNKTTLDTEYKYDPNGNVVKVTSPDGTIIERRFDSLNRKIEEKSITKDADGNTKTSMEIYSYIGDSDKISTFTDAVGNKTINEYFNDEKLFRANYSDGSTITYEYDLAGREISKIVDDRYSANSKKTSKVYDLRDREILEYVDLVNEDESVSQLVLKAYMYDVKGNVIKAIDGESYKNAEGNTITEKINNATAQINTYNVKGQLIQTLTAENKKHNREFSNRYEYDTFGNRIKEIDTKNNAYYYKLNSKGNVLEKSFISRNGKIFLLEKNTYDLLDNLLKNVDGNGNITTYEINSIGKVKTKILPSDSSIEEGVYTYKYDNLGNVAETNFSNGTVTEDKYNALGHLLKTKITGSDKKTIEESYGYDGCGRKISYKDANGNLNEYKYDLRGNKDEESINGKVIETYEYDALGNIIYKYDRFGNRTENIYDTAGRLIESKDALGVTVQKLEYYDNNCQSKAIDSLGNVTTYKYDSDSRLISKIDGENKETKTFYDSFGQVAKVVDGNGNATQYIYDGYGNLAIVTNALGETTTYTYDNNKNRLSMADGNGNTVKYKYNAANKVSKYIAANNGSLEGKEQSYTYNADGSIKNVKDRNGNVISYEYDAFGRKIKETNGDNVTTYEYDNVGNVINIKDPVETTSYKYDAENRTVLKDIEGKGSFTYTYDIKSSDQDNKIEHGEKIEDSTGREILKTFDATNRLSSVESNDKKIDYTYYSNGALKEIKFPDNSIESYTFNKNNTLNELKHIDSNGNVTDTYRYSYDNSNNITKINDNSGTKTYSYDKLNRVKQEIAPTGVEKQYTYDKAGNRLTETEISNGNSKLTNYEYDNENRLLRTYTNTNEETTYKYDNNGNLLSEVQLNTSTNEIEKTRILNYDSYNRLIAVSEDGKLLETNKYNSKGLRVEKEASGNITKYLYDGEDVLLELNGSNDVTAKNIYGTKLLSREVNSETGYYKYNGHGDVVALTNPTGQTLAKYTYDTFGNIESTEGNFNNPYRYSGYVYDEEVDYYYLQSRMYDPEIGRFLQEDTYTGDITDPLSLNRYTYCHNNPVIYDDPNGHWIHVAIGAAVGAVVGATVNVARTAIKDFKDDGKFNAGWKTYGKAAVKGAAVGAAVGVGVTTVGVGTTLKVVNAVSTAKDIYKASKKSTKSVVTTVATNYLGGKAAKAATKVIKKVAKPVVGMTLNSVQSKGAIKDKLANVISVKNITDKVNNISTSLKRNFNTIKPSSVVNSNATKLNNKLSKSTATELKNNASKSSLNKKVNGTSKTFTLPGDANRPVCFVSGTLVKSELGSKEIQDIQIGDKVYAKNVATGKVDLKEVKKTFVNETNVLVHLVVKNSDSKETKIDTTTNHPFYVQGTGWIPAKDLKTGDFLVLVDGSIAEVFSVEVEELESPVTVYNFEVEDYHTYYVADIGVLVHNDCSVGGKAIKVGTQADLPGRNGAFRAAKRDAKIPVNQQPYDIVKEPMRTAEYEGGHIIKDSNGNIIETKEYYFKNYDGDTIVIQDHSAGHKKGGQGSHFNVRPGDNTRTGKVPWTKEHYPFKR